MSEVEYFDLKKKKKGKIDLPEAIFGSEVNEHTMQETVRMQRARKRAGNASAKERSWVMGGGSKPYRQKGTGRARHGSIRSPLWEGGGVTFGPKPRSYDIHVPAKVRKTALRSTLSLYCKEERIVVLENFDVESGKTKEVAGVLEKFDLDSALIVDGKGNENLRRGVRNLPDFHYLSPEGLNVLDILKYNKLVLTLKGLEGIISRFA